MTGQDFQEEEDQEATTNLMETKTRMFLRSRQPNQEQVKVLKGLETDMETIQMLTMVLLLKVDLMED